MSLVVMSLIERNREAVEFVKKSNRRAESSRWLAERTGDPQQGVNLRKERGSFPAPTRQLTS